MKRTSIILLQTLIVIISACSLALLLIEPHFEGRNANATAFQVYFSDPFLAYVYIASIAYFAGLYQAFKLLGSTAKKQHENSIKSLRILKYCAMSLVLFVLGAEAYIFTAQRREEDTAGGIMIGLFLMIIFAGTATLVRMLEKRFIKASYAKIKS